MTGTGDQGLGEWIRAQYRGKHEAARHEVRFAVFMAVSEPHFHSETGFDEEWAAQDRTRRRLCRGL